MKTTTKRISIYIVLGGFVAFLITSGFTAVFVPYMELAKDGCLKFIELIGPNGTSEVVCSEFKTNLEEVKYYHNISMEERYSNLQLGVFFLFLSLSSLAFYFIPKWYGKTPTINYMGDNTAANYIETFGSLLLINYLVVYIIPSITLIILPSPIDWFPDIFIEISNKLRDSTLSELKDIASEL